MLVAALAIVATAPAQIEQSVRDAVVRGHRGTISQKKDVKKPQSQESTLNVETFYLKNGLKVIMAEEHSQPKIYGAVLVHAGSKNEDPKATGVAHYFEHIMFKGTDKIGTTDWESERPLLQKISDCYDKMQQTSDPAERHKIQSEINRLNIEASQYAIANETDAILQQMGCTGLNAGTTYDYTVYYNTLPANQLENWMEVYAERFRNPVYRLFQGELEAVYEERNLYANEMMYTFSRNIFTESFGEHPYSRDIIGLDEHLKNPQPSAMQRFYNKYYVASNMTLILVGDLNIAQARQMAEKYFGIWPKGDRVEEPAYKLPRFDERIVKEVKQTPIRAGLMVFPGVQNNHRDELTLEVLSEILSGGNGLIDEMVSDGKLMAAQFMPLSLQDAGSNVILYIPKLLGQKHAAAEELIWAALDSVKEGRFSDKLLQSIKMNRLVERKRQLESYSSIANLLLNLEATGSDYTRWLAENEHLQQMNEEDIMNVAARYFDRDHCTLVRSSMGFPDKESAIKPDWEHLEAKNQGAKSSFAKEIADRPLRPIRPQVIDFDRDVDIVAATPDCNVYATRNPKNDLFSLNIAYHYGLFDNHNIDQATAYFSSIGAADLTAEQYRTELECLGGSFSLSAGDDYSFINISGPEENFDKIMELVMLKLRNPRHDKQQLENLVEALKASKKAAKNDASTWTAALYEYVQFGEKSSYIDHATIKEIKKMKGEDLVALLDNIFQRDGYITFVGRRAAKEIAAIALESGLVQQDVTRMPLRIRQPLTHDADAVYYATNKKFLKSDIDFYIPSSNFDYDADRAACAMFNEYMGGGMNSVFFQEIREFRSLGYSTHGYFSYDRFNRRPARYYAYLGTQCDKTIDGIEAVRDLMLRFPDREDKFGPARDYLLSVRNSNYYTFRQLPAQVRYWKEVEQLDHDPRPEVTRQIGAMDYKALREFHKKYVEGRPLIITVSGNAKQFDKKALKQFGEVKEVKFKKMIKF